MGSRTRKAVECCKKELIGHFSWILENSSAESNVNYGGPGQEVSEGNNIRTCVRDPSCDIFTKNVAVFCFCFKNLSKAKLKSTGLISLAEEISREPNIDSVMGVLVITLMKIYNGEEQVGQTEIEHVKSEEKIAPGNLMFEPRLVLKEIRRLIKGFI